MGFPTDPSETHGFFFFFLNHVIYSLPWAEEDGGILCDVPELISYAELEELSGWWPSFSSPVGSQWCYQQAPFASAGLTVPGDGLAWPNP